MLCLDSMLCFLVSCHFFHWYLLFMERVYMGIVTVLIKIFKWKPEKKYKWEPMKEDLEMGNLRYPMVLVQIPMYNEKEVLPFFLLYNFVNAILTILLCYLSYMFLMCYVYIICFMFRCISCQLVLLAAYHCRLIKS